MDMTLSLAAIQMSMSDSRIDNVSKAERLVRQAASDGAKIILIPELFEGEYFCKEQDAQNQQRAQTIDENLTVSHFQEVAAELTRLSEALADQSIKADGTEATS
jgi:N-carbamoylputrescine amidase